MKFYKTETLSNDFIFFSNSFRHKVDIYNVCDRRKGIGADGVVFFEKTGEILSIMLVNKDGSIAGNPGNAFFCAAGLWSFLDNKRDSGVITSNGMDFYFEKADNGIKGRFGIYPEISLKDDYFEVNAGNLHRIYLKAEFSDDEIIEKSKDSENFNIEFISRDENGFKVKVFETGVGFTSGAASSALAIGACLKSEFKGKKIDLFFDGGKINLDFTQDEIYLTAYPEMIFTGEKL